MHKSYAKPSKCRINNKNASNRANRSCISSTFRRSQRHMSTSSRRHVVPELHTKPFQIKMFPEFQDFQGQFSANRFSQAASSLQRIQDTVKTFATPDMQVDLAIYRGRVCTALGQFSSVASLQATALTALQHDLQFKTALKRAHTDPHAHMSPPFVSFATATTDQPLDSSQSSISSLPNLAAHPATLSYSLVLGSSIVSLLQTQQYTAAQKLLSQFAIPQSSDAPLHSRVTHALLTGQVSAQILRDSSVSQSKQQPPAQPQQPESVTPPRKKFSLKTTHVENANNIPSSSEPLQSNEDIVQQKMQQQRDQMKQEEENSADTTQQSTTHSPTNPYSSIQPDFLQLFDSLRKFPDLSVLTESDQASIVSKLFSPQLLEEVSNLDINLPPSATSANLRQLFLNASLQFCTALQASLQHQTIQTESVTHIIDSLTHLTKLFQHLNVCQHQGEHSAIQQHLAALQSLSNQFIVSHVIGYESAQIRQDSFITISPSDVTKISPLQLTPHGPRVITSSLVLCTNSFSLVNATIKIAEQLLVDPPPAVVTCVDDSQKTIVLKDQLQSFEPNFKGFILSPLLASLGTEYLALNPVNSEGLLRSAVKYAENTLKERPTWEATQLVIDTYMAYVNVLLQLEWNGKRRTKDAQQYYQKIDQLLTQPQGADVSPHLPRYFMLSEASQQALLENHSDTASTTTSVVASPTQRGVEQWVIDRYMF